jgi:hypothetical protein
MKDGNRKTESNTEGVRKFQPRVELWQPWDEAGDVVVTLKGFAKETNPYRVKTTLTHQLSQGFKANPGLKLANTFGVKVLARP